MASALDSPALQGLFLSPELREALDSAEDKDVLSGAELLGALQSGGADVDAHVVLRGKSLAEAVVRELPEGMRIRGCLVIAEAKGAALAFPAGLVVDQVLAVLTQFSWIFPRNELKSLTFGEGLRVGECLNLSRCTVLSQLPDNAHLGRLNVKNCTSLARLPQSLRVDSDLILVGCSALQQLPVNLHVHGMLNLRDCTSLASLPFGLKVDGLLSVSGCSALEALYCHDMEPLLARLQSIMGPESNLHMNGWTRVRELPANLSFGGGLAISRWTALASLPRGLRVRGDLHAKGCTALASVPASVRVDGLLFLDGCTALRTLPEGLRVGGSLVLSNCSALTRLPEDLHVGGDLHVGLCEALESLPASVLEWPVREDTGEPHEVFLSGSGLSYETLEWLREAEAPGLRFHVDLWEGADDPFSRPGFASARQAAAFWAREAEMEMTHDVIEDTTLVQFLSRLRDAQEFGISKTRKALARRVVAVLELLGTEEDVREEVLLRMSDSLDACGDKPVWALNQMHLTVEVAKARGDRDALRDLGRRVMRLMVVHEHAKRKIDSLAWVDDVCVYLRFEIDLRKTLDLPVGAADMIFPRYIKIEDEELEAAKTDALAITEDQFEAWLAAWPEWQRQERHDVAKQLKWHDLPEASPQQRQSMRRRLSRRLSQLLNMTGDRMADPVQLNGGPVWSLSDLLRHWERTGHDLHNCVVSPDDLQRDLRRCNSK